MNNIDEIKNFVIKGYRQILQREPDNEGLSHYIDTISTGTISKDRFLDILRCSEEYISKGIYTSQNIKVKTYSYWNLYTIFDEELIKDIGIGWFDAKKVYDSIGNSPGTYPDTLLFFMKMIRKFPIKKIVELGSGFSTLYFAKICREMNIDFISYEEDQKWLEKTKRFLDHYHISADIMKIDDMDDIDYNTDLIFIDCGPIRHKIIESDKIYNIPIITIDDCEGCKSCSEFMCKTKRYRFYVYNGVGRNDRHLFVNTDLFDINKFVHENMICIGTW